MTSTTITVHPEPTTRQPAVAGRSKLLRAVLREIALFSMFCGAALAVGAGRLDTWLGINTWLLVAIGVGLVLYGDAVWLGARRETTLVLTGQAAIVGDLGWVISSVVLIAATSFLTRNGEIALAIVTIPVALFAVVQVAGLNRIATAA